MSQAAQRFEAEAKDRARRESPAVPDVRHRFVYPDDRAIEKPFDWRQMRRLLGYMSLTKRTFSSRSW